MQTIYAEHPTYQTPQAPAGQALLVARNHGLMAEADPPYFFASVGDGCLVHPQSNPSFRSPQILGGNDLVLPPGDHTLTLHDVPPGEFPECDDKPVSAGWPISARPGDRLLAFPYRLPGTTEINLLVIPFDER